MEIENKLLHTILNNIETYEDSVPRTWRFLLFAVKFKAGERRIELYAKVCTEAHSFCKQKVNVRTGLSLHCTMLFHGFSLFCLDQIYFFTHLRIYLVKSRSRSCIVPCPPRGKCSMTSMPNCSIPTCTPEKFRT